MSSALPTAPIEPMLAKIAEALPTGEGFLFEPKWDGFRALVFRGNEQTYLQSRDLRPLNRYFPELEKALHEALPKGCVLDGEIVVASPGGLDFDALQQRIHPAASRIARLSKETPASFATRDTAGWTRCCSVSKSSVPLVTTMISPSRTQPLGRTSASACCNSGK